MPEILDLPARHSRHHPVFVIGVARSGTSLLCSLMRRYLKVNFGTESQFVVRVYRRLPSYGDLNDLANLRRLVDDVAAERCFRRWTLRFGFVLDQEKVFREVSNGRRSFAGVLQAIFSQFARYHGMERWGDRTPEYNYDLPVLLSLFPQAQFLHVVRDGRDVALSMLRAGFGGANIYRVGVAWRKQMLLVRQFLEPLPAGQARTIQYESLLADPVKTLDTIRAFLGIADDPSLTVGIAGDVHLQIRATNTNKWTVAMRPAQQRLFETVAGDQLQRAGYPILHEPRGALTLPTRLYWEADHLIRKVVRPQCWADQLYRATTAKTSQARPEDVRHSASFAEPLISRHGFAAGEFAAASRHSLSISDRRGRGVRRT